MTEIFKIENDSLTVTSPELLVLLAFISEDAEKLYAGEAIIPISEVLTLVNSGQYTFVPLLTDNDQQN